MNKCELIERLYHKYRYLMLHIAFDILKDRNLAEDAVQEAFTRLAKNNYRINEISCKETEAFIVIVTRSTSIEIYRKRKKNDNNIIDAQITEIKDLSANPAEVIITEEGIGNIRKAIRLLNPIYADVITLKYLHNCSTREIAQLLSISEENVYIRLHRGKKLLAKELFTKPD